MKTVNPGDDGALKITTIPCAFDNFSYLLICGQTGEAAVVDPTEAFPVWREVEAAGVKLVAALCTHHHHDHVGGLEDLLAEQPQLRVYAHESEVERIPFLTHPLAAHAGLTIGNLTGLALHTPGHTRGSVCYLFGDRLFTGDTLFGAGCGRLFEGTPEQMFSSLHTVIAKLPGETQLYFGHEYTEHNLKFAARVEPDNRAVTARLQELQAARLQGEHSTPSSLALEVATNPFLRCGSASIHSQFPGVGTGASEVEIFTLLRSLRNNH